MSASDRRVEVRYEGRVQGVGFRWTVERLTTGRRVTGWVRNEEDGSVRLVAEGTEAELTDFLAAIAASRVGRFILNRTVAWRDATGEFAGFEIRY